MEMADFDVKNQAKIFCILLFILFMVEMDDSYGIAKSYLGWHSALEQHKSDLFRSESKNCLYFHVVMMFGHQKLVIVEMAFQHQWSGSDSLVQHAARSVSDSVTMKMIRLSYSVQHGPDLRAESRQIR